MRGFLRTFFGVLATGIMLKTSAIAGQISVINPAAGSSITGVTSPVPTYSLLGPQVSNMGALPSDEREKPLIVLDATRDFLFQSINAIDISKFSAEQKQILINKIRKNLKGHYLDPKTKNFLNSELEKLSNSLN